MMQVATSESLSPEQFVFWLQGFAELNASPPTQAQWQSIREHLNLVFKKVTPDVNPIQPTFTPIEWPKLPDGQPIFIC
jgi:hypothetical protein